MADLFAGRPTQLSDPASNVALITPHDTNLLAYTTRAIFWTSGTLKVLTPGASSVILPSSLAGQIVPLRVTKVFATDTTATEIVGLW